MERNNSLPLVIGAAGFICLAAIAPGLFAALLGIGTIVIVAAFVLGGFVVLLQHWNLPWPIGILGGVLLLGLIWPPILGLVLGAGLVGGLFMVVFAVIQGGR